MPNQPGSTITKSDYAEYLQSEHWRETRKQRIEDGTGACERCEIPRWLAEIAYDQDLHVHHKHYRSKGREEYDDLEVLCRRCHDIETFGRSSLHEVPATLCELCGAVHWNPRGTFCERCDLLVGIDCERAGLEQYMGLKHPSFGVDEALWHQLLTAIFSHLRFPFGGENRGVATATNDVLTALSELERRANRQYGA